MNVAELSLCKELYELSGWVDVESYWEYYPVANKSTLRHSAPGNVFPDDKILPDYITPAYSLGYLLRKLPLVTLKHVALDSDDLKRWNCITEQWGVLRNHYADTPEDAACKLAIELFKQGIL
jgi:hypothetical protein